MCGPIYDFLKSEAPKLYLGYVKLTVTGPDGPQTFQSGHLPQSLALSPWQAALVKLRWLFGRLYV